MKPRISMITLGVSDLGRATSFYRDGLGLPTHGDYPGVTFFSLEGTWLALYPRAELAADAGVPCPAQVPGAVALAHNVVSREAVDQLLQTAVNAGANLCG